MKNKKQVDLSNDTSTNLTLNKPRLTHDRDTKTSVSFPVTDFLNNILEEGLIKQQDLVFEFDINIKIKRWYYTFNSKLLDNEFFKFSKRKRKNN